MAETLPLHERLAFELRELNGRIERAEEFIRSDSSFFNEDVALLQDQLTGMRAYRRALMVRYAKAALED